MAVQLPAQPPAAPAEAAPTGNKKAEPSSILKLYWDIASNDAPTRLKATALLLHSLSAFQASWLAAKPSAADGEASTLEHLCAPDTTYAIRRLIRGLGSSRESARLGFSVAFTEVGGGVMMV